MSRGVPFQERGLREIMKRREIRSFVLVLVLEFLLTGCSSRREEFVINAADSGFYAEEETAAQSTPGAGKMPVEETDRDDQTNRRITADGQTGEKTEQNGEAVPAPEVYVDVCGAVRHPGVYRLPEGSRIFEAVRMAGGFTEEAASASVNQALPLSDGQQLIVLTKEEFHEKSQVSDVPYGQETAASESGRVNINTAGREELMKLSGIGETRAEAILSYRETHGGFTSVEELLQVSGIKEGTLAKIKDRITTG